MNKAKRFWVLLLSVILILIFTACSFDVHVNLPEFEKLDNGRLQVLELYFDGENLPMYREIGYAENNKVLTVKPCFIKDVRASSEIKDGIEYTTVKGDFESAVKDAEEIIIFDRTLFIVTEKNGRFIKLKYSPDMENAEYEDLENYLKVLRKNLADYSSGLSGGCYQ